MKIGTTFCARYAENFGLDAKETFGRILALGLAPIRIGIYWDQVEIEPSVFDFSNFDWIIKMAESKNVSLILTLGAKAPRWPEFYAPKFLIKKFNFRYKERISNRDFQKHLFVFIRRAIERYKDYKNIRWWQIENEPFDLFGPQKWNFSFDFIEEEIKFVRSLSKKPIILNTAGVLPYHPLIQKILGYDLRKANCEKLADIVGFDIYPKITKKILGQPLLLKAKRSNWEDLAKWKEKAEALGKKTWVVELQAEPWEVAPMNLHDPYANPSCSPKDIEKYLGKLEKIGFNTVLFWGAEFWFACAKQGNREWLEGICAILKDFKCNML